MDYQIVKHEHGEKFLQSCIDHGNSPATAAKKLRGLKRIFQLAVIRGLLEANPLQYVKQPKVVKQPIRIFNDEECVSMIDAAEDIGEPFHWRLFILTALCTGMRRGELLNVTWQDIDFERQKIHVSPKKDSQELWEWNIKDTDRRTLPLTEALVDLLARHQAAQPKDCPYVFVPTPRYEWIQELRLADKWSVRKGQRPVNNFTRNFHTILKRANVKLGEFHDLRRTCLTNWLGNGLSEYDVMNLAGHSSFETTRTFYLAVRHDILDKARSASTQAMQGISIAKKLQLPFSPKNE